MSGWDKSQVRFFAKQIAEKYQPAWFVLAMDVREAIVSDFVLNIVLGQIKEAVNIEDVRALRIAICKRLASNHRMRTETAEQHNDNPDKEPADE